MADIFRITVTVSVLNRTIAQRSTANVQIGANSKNIVLFTVNLKCLSLIRSHLTELTKPIL